MIIPILIIIATLFVAVPTVYGFLIGAPIFFSPKKAIRAAMEHCEIKPGEKFYDLGMGTGRVMILAAREFHADVTGFELSPALYAVSMINLLFHRVKKPTLGLKNFYNQDLGGADVVFCFLTPPAMARLKPKFEKELRSGSRVISYAFHIEGWEPESIVRAMSPGNVYIYRV